MSASPSVAFSSSGSRLTRITRRVVAIQSQPPSLSPRPTIASRSGAGAWSSASTRPERRNARPSAVPIQSTPCESSTSAFTLSEGSPSAVRRVVQAAPERAARPWGVPTHKVPSEVSAIALTLLEGKPSSVVKVRTRPSRRRPSPPLSVPAQTLPSRLS